MDRHHGCPHAHTCDLCFKFSFKFAREVRNVGRRPAHVKADDFVKTRSGCRAHHPDDAARRAGQNRVLTLKFFGIGESAVALHEHHLASRHFTRHLINIASQNRRQICVDDGGIATGNNLHHRTCFVRNRYLRKTHGARHFSNPYFVLMEAIAVHQHDGNGPKALVPQRLQAICRIDFIQWNNNFAARANSFLYFHDICIKQFGKLDMPIKNARAILVTDAQLIAKAFRNEKCCRLALAFEQGVRRDSRSHLYGFYLLDRDGRVFRQREEMTNPRDCCIPILLGVFREELVCQQCAIRLFGDDIGKRATAVDPELPATGTIISGVFCGHDDWNSAVRLAIIAIQSRGKT